MIKREHIKQAIDAISGRAPDIGRALDELLGVGRIGTAAQPEDSATDTDFHFFFDKEKVRVKKFIFINEGTAPIERGLLIKYGELLRKRELIEGRRERDFLRAAREVRAAGLRLMVAHEIDAAIERARRLSDADTPGGADSRIAVLNGLKSENPARGIPASARDDRVIFSGAVEDGRQALFIPFPFCHGRPDAGGGHQPGILSRPVPARLPHARPGAAPLRLHGGRPHRRDAFPGLENRPFLFRAGNQVHRHPAGPAQRR